MQTMEPFVRETGRKKIAIIGLYLFCLLPLVSGQSTSVNGQSTPASLNKLSAEQRKTIVSEATKALSDFAQANEKGREIPESLCGPSIVQLNPLRVVKDFTNVKIVLTEVGDSQTGLYIVTPGSSYSPTRKRFAELTKLSESGDKSAGILYRYREVRSPGR